MSLHLHNETASFEVFYASSQTAVTPLPINFVVTTASLYFSSLLAAPDFLRVDVVGTHTMCFVVLGYNKTKYSTQFDNKQTFNLSPVERRGALSVLIRGCCERSHILSVENV